MEVLQIIDAENDKVHNIEVSHEDAIRAVADLQFATMLLQKEKAREMEKKNFITAFKMVKEFSSSASSNSSSTSAVHDDAPYHTSAINRELNLELAYNICNNNELPEEQRLTREFTEDATRLLLSLYEARIEKFRGKNIKKNSLWREIQNEMSEMGYNFTENELERKFRNLKRHFLNIKDNNTKSGRGRPTWPYFDILEIFARDVSVNPAPCISYLPIKSTSVSHTLPESPPPSGCDFVRIHHPETEMMPEHSTPQEIAKVTTQRRLRKNKCSTKTSESPHAKRVRQAQPKHFEKILQTQATQIDDLKIAILDSNNIQRERNELLKALINKL